MTALQGAVPELEQVWFSNCTTKETLGVLIKLLVADATCVLNASRAEAP